MDSEIYLDFKKKSCFHFEKFYKILGITNKTILHKNIIDKMKSYSLI